MDTPTSSSKDGTSQSGTAAVGGPAAAQVGVVAEPDRLRPITSVQLSGESNNHDDPTVASEITLQSTPSIFRPTLYPSLQSLQAEESSSDHASPMEQIDEEEEDETDLKSSGSPSTTVTTIMLEAEKSSLMSSYSQKTSNSSSKDHLESFSKTDKKLLNEKDSTPAKDHSVDPAAMEELGRRNRGILEEDTRVLQTFLAASGDPLVVPAPAPAPERDPPPPVTAVESIPGAHPQPGLAVFDRQLQEICETPPDAVAVAAPPPETTPPTHDQGNAIPVVDNSGLAVANAVQGEDSNHNHENLPQAQEEDVEATRNKRDERRDRHTIIWQRNILFAVTLLLVIVIVVLLAVVIPSNSGSTQTDDETQYYAQQRTTTAPSASPSQAPTSVEGSILSLLPDETILAIQQHDGNDAEGEEQSSPQSKAFQWILEDITNHNPFLSDERIKQRFALVTLYYATQGYQWISNDDWLNHTIHECDWFTKSDFAMTNTFSTVYPGWLSEFLPPPTANCNEEGQYQHLWLDQINLEGSLSNELYLMTSLKTFSVGSNLLQGTISTLVGQLTNLEGFAYFFQENGGLIPSQLGLLTKLRGLVILGNDHSGSIPSQLWKLTDLSTIIAASNSELTGTIPTQIGTSSSLKYFSVADCNLSGTIPTQVGMAKSLEWFVVMHNKRLTGTIPTELGLPSNAWLFAFSDAALTGTIPTELLSFPSIALLSFRENFLTGTIPTQVGLLASDDEILQRFDCGENQLSGTLPSELGLLKKVQRLGLRNNMLTGTIPSQLGSLPLLEWLELRNNSLLGKIPTELSANQQILHTLQLWGNPLLSGTIPEALCNITGTCIFNALHLSCRIPGLTFDCTNLLCGCDCTCSSDE